MTIQESIANGIERIAEKTSSGRWILAVLSGTAFLWATVAGILSADQVMAVCMLVFGFYFGQRSVEKPL
jgi:hypothetical protein